MNVKVWMDERVVGIQMEIYRILFLSFIRAGIFSNWTNPRREKERGIERKQNKSFRHSLSFSSLSLSCSSHFGA
jgi:hypothetical protein